MRAGDGVVGIARLSGAAILPAACAAAPRRLLAPWDRFMIPLPFSRGVILWGEPVRVGPRDDVDAVRRSLEETLNRLAAEADQSVGASAVDPAPA